MKCLLVQRLSHARERTPRRGEQAIGCCVVHEQVGLNFLHVGRAFEPHLLEAAPANQEFPGKPHDAFRRNHHGHRHGSVPDRLAEFGFGQIVFCERFSGEKFRVVGSRFGSQHHRDLAAHVRVLVIVPAELGSHNAVADKNRPGTQFNLFACSVTSCRKILFQFKLDGSARVLPGEPGRPDADAIE